MATAKAPSPTNVGTKDLWMVAQSKLSEDANAGLRVEGLADTNVLFVGSKGSGKTSLIARFRAQSASLTGKDDPKPTVALEYSHRVGKKENTNLKQVAHLWELGGGLLLEKLTATVVTPENLPSLVIAIVLDLGDPGSVLDTLVFWLQKIRAMVSDASKRLQDSGQSLPEKLDDPVAKTYGSEHPDRSAVWPIGIPVLVLANKYDLFAKVDSSKAKTICSALRFVCHLNGATLLFTSIQQEAQIKQFLVLMNHHVFKTSQSKTVVVDPMKPLQVPVGSDTFQAIGGISRPPASPLELAGWREENTKVWVGEIAAAFQPVDRQERHGKFDPFNAKYREAIVDELRSVKDKQLELYRTEYDKKATEERQKLDKQMQEQLQKVRAAAGRKKA